MHRHRQVHLWITEGDYRLLRELADDRNETLSSVMRRLIRGTRRAPVESGAARGILSARPVDASSLRLRMQATDVDGGRT